MPLLSEADVNHVIDEAFGLLTTPGIKVLSEEARSLLYDRGATIDLGEEIVHIPETLGRWALDKAPREFWLYARDGRPAVHYGGDQVHFNPGSSAVNVLDSDTLEHRPARTPDLVKLIKVVEMLPAYDAQSTAAICQEIPEEIGDIYRLYLVLLLSDKPIVTGAFTVSGSKRMIEMLQLASGDSDTWEARPRAIFDVCPTPPLVWSDFGAQNLIDLAAAGIPAQIVSMPLAGAAAPVTLYGSIVQHAAECISGITIHQSANPGAPVVWGGAPAIFDMRHGTTPMGAVETALIDAACAQVGKQLGLPTHAYLGASDAKIVDAQAGLESGLTALIGAMAGINMISGPGMLDFLACQSIEKLIIDGEAIAMVRRLFDGVTLREDMPVSDFFTGFNFKADFLKQKVTRQLFHEEQYLTSPLIDRGSLRTWQQMGGKDTFARARDIVVNLAQEYDDQKSGIENAVELESMMTDLARIEGMPALPPLG